MELVQCFTSMIPKHFDFNQEKSEKRNIEDNSIIFNYMLYIKSRFICNIEWQLIICEHNPLHSSISWIGKSINKCKRCQIKIERFELFNLEKRIIFLEKYDVFVSVCNIGKFD